MLRGLFEGTRYNSEARAKCAVYSRAQTKQGHGVIKEIRYMPSVVRELNTVLLLVEKIIYLISSNTRRATNYFIKILTRPLIEGRLLSEPGVYYNFS